jgi:hypothetical protein
VPVKTTPRSSPPPKPEARKTVVINARFEDKAKRLLRSVLTETGNDYGSLAGKLNAIGIGITGRGLENKVSRGGFSAAFLLQCLAALGIKTVV